MSTFKVICKANSNDWTNEMPITKLVTTKSFFGLKKTTSVISEHEKVPGPGKEEVCVVTDEYTRKLKKYYILAGYPYGGYDARYFVRMDEIYETEKEVAEKNEPAFN